MSPGASSDSVCLWPMVFVMLVPILCAGVWCWPGVVQVVGWLIAAAAEGVSEEDKARARAAAVNTSDEEGWTPLLVSHKSRNP